MTRSTGKRNWNLNTGNPVDTLPRVFLEIALEIVPA
jgi:hypothetical protein